MCYSNISAPKAFVREVDFTSHIALFIVCSYI